MRLIPSASEEALSSEHLTRDLGRRTASGGVIAIGTQVLVLLMQLGYMAMMARLLQPEDFGLVAMAASVTAFVGVFADMGLSMATIQRKELDHDTVSALFFLNLAAGFVLMLVTWLMAPLAAWTFNDRRLLDLVLVLALAIPITAAGAQHKALLTRNMQWPSLHGVSLGSLLCGFAVGIAMAWVWDFGYWSLAAATLTTASVGTVGQWMLSPWRPSRVGNWKGSRSAINFGVNLSAFNAINYFHRQADNILIGYYLGSAQLGFYTRAYSIFTLPISLVNGPLATAFIPALSRLQTESSQWRKAFLDMLALVTIIGSAIAASLFVLAAPLVTLLLGPSWAASAKILNYLSLSIFVSTPLSAMGWIYISLEQTNRMFAWSIFATAMILAAFAIGLSDGASGVALAYSVVIYVLALPSFWYASRKAPVSMGDISKTVFPIVGAGIVSTTVLWLPPYWSSSRVSESPVDAIGFVLVKFPMVAGLYCVLVGLACVISPRNRGLVLRVIPFLSRNRG
ncbi:lipopolysaccharide biosynthesis protein [Mesorhizobium ventifaucium]|uniref:Polysacc_synt_C domain-containing protein n=1 Tax=Mesorhizobium ventifaucium TaxID=666020 RepID=A0ABM9DKK9_9HYPH|nr:lipopolysaccharide biosynthesis protein [Mesorhizobium ventifaucium]CAH2396611.1 Polysacc_synt_C domain-containing protein [Mesorhizobium ventifaucium]